MGSSETSLGVKAECLELLGHLADVPQVARNSGAKFSAILCAVPRNYSDRPHLPPRAVPAHPRLRRHPPPVDRAAQAPRRRRRGVGRRAVGEARAGEGVPAADLPRGHAAAGARGPRRRRRRRPRRPRSPLPTLTPRPHPLPRPLFHDDPPPLPPARASRRHPRPSPPQLVELLHSASASARLAGLHALAELLFDNVTNQVAAMRAGVVEPCVSLARAEAAEISKGARWDASRTWRLIHARSPTAHLPAPPSTGAATLLCQLVLTEAEGGTRGVKMHVEVRLQVTGRHCHCHHHPTTTPTNHRHCHRLLLHHCHLRLTSSIHPLSAGARGDGDVAERRGPLGVGDGVGHRLQRPRRQREPRREDRAPRARPPRSLSEGRHAVRRPRRAVGPRRAAAGAAAARPRSWASRDPRSPTPYLTPHIPITGAGGSGADGRAQNAARARGDGRRRQLGHPKSRAADAAACGESRREHGGAPPA